MEDKSERQDLKKAKGRKKALQIAAGVAAFILIVGGILLTRWLSPESQTQRLVDKLSSAASDRDAEHFMELISEDFHDPLLGFDKEMLGGFIGPLFEKADKIFIQVKNVAVEAGNKTETIAIPDGWMLITMSDATVQLKTSDYPTLLRARKEGLAVWRLIGFQAKGVDLNMFLQEDDPNLEGFGPSDE